MPKNDVKTDAINALMENEGYERSAAEHLVGVLDSNNFLKD